MNWICASLLVLFSVKLANGGGSILFYFPYISKSMQITYMQLAEELNNLGHQITVVHPYLVPKASPGILQLINDYQSMEAFLEGASIGKMKKEANRASILANATQMKHMNSQALKLPRIQSWIRDSTTKFDAVIVMPMWMNEVGYYLAHKFDASLVLFSSYQVSFPWINEAMGQPTNFAYMPNMFLSYGPQMTFWERLLNTYNGYWFQYVYKDGVILKRIGTGSE